MGAYAVGIFCEFGAGLAHDFVNVAVFIFGYYAYMGRNHLGFHIKCNVKHPLALLNQLSVAFSVGKAIAEITAQSRKNKPCILYSFKHFKSIFFRSVRPEIGTNSAAYRILLYAGRSECFCFF